MRVATAEQMRAIDRAAQEDHGLTGAALMERAGADLAAVTLRRFTPQRVCVVCGKGNNAGDGFVLARHLKDAGVAVTVVGLAPREEIRGDAAGALARLLSAGIEPTAADDLAAQCSAADVVVDALLGTGAAWWVAMYRFPGRGILEWALLLPLAMPTYVIAYVYTDLLQYAGPVQTALREAFGWERGEYWFPDVRSLGGAILVFSLVFYPYVYVLARAAFMDRSGNLMEVPPSDCRSGP